METEETNTNTSIKTVKEGLYLVIDPSLNQIELLTKLDLALQGGVSMVQIWDHWPSEIDKNQIIQFICNLCHNYEVPVFINNDWTLIAHLPLDGVHFDRAPNNLSEIKAKLNQDFLIGITCTNNLKIVRWAEEEKIDYISFCSIFPSSTSTSCELVNFKTIEEARKITSIPLFLAGGIQKSNLYRLKDLNYDGIALVSGIMSAANPAAVTQDYITHLKEHRETRHGVTKSHKLNKRDTE